MYSPSCASTKKVSPVYKTNGRRETASFLLDRFVPKDPIKLRPLTPAWDGARARICPLRIEVGPSLTAGDLWLYPNPTYHVHHGRSARRCRRFVDKHALPAHGASVIASSAMRSVSGTRDCVENALSK